MKKKIIIMLIMLIMIGTVSFAYTDTDNHWANQSIEKLSVIRLLNGYEDDTFRPDNNMTRAELISLVSRMLNLQTASNRYIPDVESTDWYSGDVRKMVYAGIIMGDEAGNINPNSLISREEAIVILSRAFNITSNSTSLGTFTDKGSVSEWAKKSFSTFITYEYINGYSDNTIRPSASVTRAEIITLFDRIFAEIIISGEYTGQISGNALINSDDVILNDVTVVGDLILAEGLKENIQINNLIVNKDIILRAEIDLNKFNTKVYGNIIDLTDNDNKVEANNRYVNGVYGISFTLPDNVTVIEKGVTPIDYTVDNLITIEIKRNEESHFKTLEEIARTEISKYDNGYQLIKKGTNGTSSYAIYTDINNSQAIVIKRHDVTYTLLFYNISYSNLSDNIISSIKFTEGEAIHEHYEVTYKNTRLSLKFRYLDYIGVDDSYNTNKVFEGNTYFKLFIQVNTITDMNKYSNEQVYEMLKLLEENSGEYVSSRIRNIRGYNGFEFIIKDEQKLVKSVYIVVGDRLYKFIFTGTYEQLNSIGFDLFENVLSTVEF